MRLDDLDLLPNYIALWIAITKGITNADQAIGIAEQAWDNPFTVVQVRVKRTEEQKLEVLRLKNEGMTYPAIGELLGIHWYSVYNIVRKLEGRI